MGRTDYSEGDYRVVAERLRPAAVELVAWCDPKPGTRVLDSACGTGNVAAACLSRGCRVVAFDLEFAQLKAFEAPAGSSAPLLVGDAMALPFAEHCVDHVLSAFGMVYAPEPEQVAAEAARVCRPGGWVALTSWAEDGFQPRARAILAHLESGVGQSVPEIAPAWTSEGALEHTLGPVGAVETRRGWLESQVASAADWWETTSAAAPPVVAARSRLSPADFERLGEELQELVTECSVEVEGGLVLRQEYLMARARVR